MFLIRFLRTNSARPARGAGNQPFKPALEVLDARTLPSTLVVGAANEPPAAELSHAPARVDSFGGLSGGVIANANASTAIWVGHAGGAAGRVDSFGGLAGGVLAGGGSASAAIWVEHAGGAADGVVGSGGPGDVEPSTTRSSGEEIPQ